MLNPVGLEWSNNIIETPALTGLSDGTYLALWCRPGQGSGEEIVGRIQDADGSSIGGTFVVRTVATGSLFLPVAAALSEGRFAVAWTNNTDGLGAFRLETQIFKAGGVAASGITEVGTGAGYPEITALGNGGYAIAFVQQGFKSVVFGPGGLAGPVIAGLAGTAQSIAALKNGSYVTVVDTHPTATTTDVKIQLHRSGGQVSETLVKSLSTAAAAVEVAGLESGNFVVVWQDGVGAGSALKARIYNSEAQPVGQEITLASNFSGDELAVEALPGGEFVVAFVQGGANQDVFVATYTETGTTITPPSAIGRSTAGIQFSPSIAVLKDGRYVVSWDDINDSSAHFQTFDPRKAGLNLRGDDADDNYVGTRFADLLEGAGGKDRLVGEDGNDVLNGGLGADELVGGLGDDVYYVDNGGDRVVETDTGGLSDRVFTTVSYTLTAFVEDLMAIGGGAMSLMGNASSNSLVGSEGANTIRGELGNDKIWGQLGQDVLYGGQGRDIFVFNTKPNKKTNFDAIKDFQVKDDTIWLDNAIFKKLGKGTDLQPGKLKKAFFTIGDRAKDKNDYLRYSKKTGLLTYDADGSGHSKAVEIAKLSKALKMTAADFNII